MSLPIRVMPRARADFRHLHAYIAQRSPQGAERWRQAFETAADFVAQRPEVGGLAPEHELSGHELRQKLFKTRSGLTYRFVYTVDKGEVLVLRIRGPGQPPLDPDEI